MPLQEVKSQPYIWYERRRSSVKPQTGQFSIYVKRGPRPEKKNCWALKIQAQPSEHDKETDKVKCCSSLNIMELSFRAISSLSTIFDEDLLETHGHLWKGFYFKLNSYFLLRDLQNLWKKNHEKSRYEKNPRILQIMILFFI